MNLKPKLVKVIEVSRITQNLKQIRGFSIDNPKVESWSSTYTVVINGWVLGQNIPVTSVLLVNDKKNEVIRRTAVHLQRPDIAKIYPELSEAKNCGFSIVVSVLGMPIDVKLHLQAILQNQSKVELGCIRLQRYDTLHCDYEPKLQPLMITSLGRSGSTWLMHVLTEHPNIIIHREYPYETHGAKYWIYSLFKVLSEPTNYLNPNAPNQHLSGLNIQWLRGQLTQDNWLNQWFTHSYTKQIVTFCQQSTDAFYTQVANRQGQMMTQQEQKLTYFAEKFGPWQSTAELCYELYPKTREIILVRDFRDMLCSMQIFSEQRGVKDFGLTATTTDLQAINQIKHSVKRLLYYWQKRAEQAHLVHYEDLVLHPNETFQKILDYLNLELNSSTVKKMLKSSSKDTPEMKEHRTSNNPKKSIGRWQHDLNDSLKALCEEHLADELQAFGYETK
jgi:hypothetical protein